MVAEADVSAFAEALARENERASLVLARARLEEAAAASAVRVPPHVFGGFVACRLDPAETIDASLAKLHVVDLYLACACVEAIPGAADAFLALYAPVVSAIAHKSAARRLAEDDLTQLVVKRLLVSDADVPARIAQYRGTGPLLGFVRVTAARLAVNATESRALRSEVLTPHDDLFTAVFAGSRDPEASLDRERVRKHLRAAFETATSSLEPRERNVLAFSLCDGLSIDAISRMYGVHRATAARWIQNARDAIVSVTRIELARALSLGESEVDSLFRDGLSRFDLSVERCLKDVRT